MEPHRTSGSRRSRKTAARLSALALIVYGCDSVTGEELATKLGVNMRTIYRDIAQLQEIGFPIVSAPGPGGGFTFDYGSASDRAISTEQDLLDLFTRTGLLTTDKATLEAVIGFASDSLDHQDLQTLRRASERILFDPEEWYTRDRPTADFSAVRQAVLHDHRLRVSYTERTGSEIIEDMFDPYGLIWKGGFWYVYGYSRRNRCYRRIRIQRLVRVLDTCEVFIRPKEFDLLKHWREELEAYGKGTTRVLLRIDQPAIPEFENFNWKRENRIVKAKDHWLVEMYVDRFEWLIPLVLSYAGSVRILAPRELRNRIAAAAQAVLAFHSHSGNAASANDGLLDDSRSRAALNRRTNQE